MGTSSWVLFLVGYRSRRLLVSCCTPLQFAGQSVVGFMLLLVLGELVQTTAGEWITHPPARCPNGHPSAPARCSSGIWPASGTAAGTPHGPAALAMRRYTGAAHRSTNCTNVEASQNYGICCAQRPDQAPAGWQVAPHEKKTSMKKLAIRRGHRINETQAESAIKDYVDHAADIAKFHDGTGGTPKL